MNYWSKCKTVKLLEDNIGENLGDFEFGGHLLDIPLTVWPMKGKIGKMDFIKTKNFRSAKDTVKNTQ